MTHRAAPFFIPGFSQQNKKSSQPAAAHCHDGTSRDFVKGLKGSQDKRTVNKKNMKYINQMSHKKKQALYFPFLKCLLFLSMRVFVTGSSIERP